MKNILILDTETTGLSPLDGFKVIEIAVILFNIEKKTILQQFSTLLPATENPAYKVNKITAEASQEPMAYEEAKAVILSAAKHADAVVAHNAEFDRQWMSSIGMLEIERMKWICSCHDFAWPYVAPGGKSLISIALSLGLPIISAHRALADCQLLAACFEKIKDLGERLEKAKAGKFLYKALVGFDNRQLAKDAGFSWNTLIPNAWSCKLSVEEAAEIKGFEIQQWGSQL